MYATIKLILLFLWVTVILCVCQFFTSLLVVKLVAEKLADSASTVLGGERQPTDNLEFVSEHDLGGKLYTLWHDISTDEFYIRQGSNTTICRTLAQAQAHLGKIASAIQEAQS